MEREMGGKVKREGTCVYLWLIHVDVRQKPSWSLSKFTSIESVEEGMASHSSVLAVRTPSLYCMLYKDFHSKMDLRMLIAWVNHLALLQGSPVHSSVLNDITYQATFAVSMVVGLTEPTLNRRIKRIPLK